MDIGLGRVLRIANMAIGNGKNINCKVKGYRQRITLSIITAYLMFFVIGLFLGDLSATQEINIEETVSTISTILVTSLGTNILYNCWRKTIKSKTISIGAVTIMGAQIAYIFNLFSPPIVHTLFEIAAIVSMVIMFIYSHTKESN